MFIACKCLNVLISVNKNEHQKNIHIPILNHFNLFNDSEFEEIFVQQSEISVEVQLYDLLYSQLENDWKFYRCINCSTKTHAHNFINCNEFLINSKLMTNQEEINKLKSSDFYSPIFKMIIKKNYLSLNLLGKTTINDLVVSKASSMREKYHEILTKEIAATEKRVSDYSESQFEKLKEFKERGEEEYKVLFGLINTTGPVEQTSEQVMNNDFVTNKITHLTPPTTPIENSPPNKKQQKILQSPANKNAKDFVDNSIVKQHKDSADSDCLFDLDMDIEESIIDDDNNLSETDDEQDGVNPVRQYNKQNSCLAKSLPISMPVMGHRNIDIEDEDDKSDDNIDIAASIQAMAKSVRDNVFGDLPRPRFSTQI